MYLPPTFQVTDEAEVAALLDVARLCCLVTHGPLGLFASHLPLIHDAARGVLQGHLARSNPHRERAGSGEALVILSGAEAYVSPGFYPSKADHGRVVPTWNYEVAHVYGHLSWIEDASWLRTNVAALTGRFEAGRPQPWAITDAPATYVEERLTAIVGVELRIERIEAKRKLSQNRSASDRAGVVAGLSASEREGDRAIATAMSQIGDGAS